MYRTSPFTTAFTRCRFGMKRRLVIAVTCVPMPPFFLALPLRQMWLPLMEPLPVNSQIRAIKFQSQKLRAQKVAACILVARSYLGMAAANLKRCHRGKLPFAQRHGMAYSRHVRQRPQLHSSRFSVAGERGIRCAGVGRDVDAER